MKRNVFVRWVIALISPLLLTGCLWGATLDVDDAVTRDMRSAGKVLAETKTEAVFDSTTVVTRIVIADVGSSNAESALLEATRRLQARGWKVSDRRPAQWVEMTANGWPDIQISIFSPSFFVSSGKPEPQVEKALQTARGKDASENFVILDAHRIDG
ncbi:hypothetical protein [Nonomuraea indica]|uniref:hypothetical protein n=1 Tax=Nonomuraea indica TaxID=1581193 RepID=UPI001181F227|nr:hypothetical protein [Nonomuraea indica]